MAELLSVGCLGCASVGCDSFAIAAATAAVAAREASSIPAAFATGFEGAVVVAVTAVVAGWVMLPAEAVRGPLDVVLIGGFAFAAAFGAVGSGTAGWIRLDLGPVGGFAAPA